MTKQIPLTQGKFALVDAVDYEWLNQWKWQAYTDNNAWYANRTVYVGSSKKNTKMHRVIMDAPNGMEVDHINGNGLDNRRENLRLCTHAQNSCNKGKRKNTSSFKGVYWDKSNKTFRAQIGVGCKKIMLGSFDNAVDAARAYDIAARKYHGEFASVNFPERAMNEMILKKVGNDAHRNVMVR